MSTFAVLAVLPPHSHSPRHRVIRLLPSICRVPPSLLFSCLTAFVRSRRCSKFSPPLEVRETARSCARMASERVAATRPRQSRVYPTGLDRSNACVGAEARSNAALVLQASFRGKQCRVRVDIPTVQRRLKQLQVDRQGFVGLGRALVVAVAMVAVIFLQSDVGGAHAVELALRHAVRPLPHSTPGLDPNSLPKPCP